MSRPVSLLNKIIPFLMVGIALVAFVLGIMLMVYLFLFGAIVGFILFIISWIRQRYFLPKPKTKASAKSGRIIDSDDWKRM